ncbi:MAG: aromatic amino acid transport family protein [Nanoarchaeota archaeon]|nr:aromatic amino acid transport family protein [Nanoarchaeota archaeon]
MLTQRGDSTADTGFFARHKFWIAVTTLVGTIVGAGILGIPYVVAKAGFLVGFILILVLGIAFIFLNLFAGEVILRTKEQHQLTGYAEKYLGKNGKRIMTFTMLFSIYGALTAYLIGEGATLHAIFQFGEPLYYSLIFFFLAVCIIWKGMKSTGKAELILISLLFLVVIFITVFSYNNLNFSNFTFFDFGKIFLPYGIILFAMTGSPAIPEMQQVLVKDKKLLKKAIIVGTCIPIILYIVFTFVIMGLVGLDQFEVLAPNERIATVALSMYAHPILGILANFLAILSMFTSFLTLGTALTQVYEYDYALSRSISMLLTFMIPLIIVLFNLTTFITILGITGAIAGGLDGILITLMYWKAKVLGDRTPEYSLPPYTLIGSLLIVLFVFGIVYQLWASVIA